MSSIHEEDRVTRSTLIAEERFRGLALPWVPDQLAVTGSRWTWPMLTVHGLIVVVVDLRKIAALRELGEPVRCYQR